MMNAQNQHPTILKSIQHTLGVMLLQGVSIANIQMCIGNVFAN